MWKDFFIRNVGCSWMLYSQWDQYRQNPSWMFWLTKLPGEFGEFGDVVFSSLLLYQNGHFNIGTISVTIMIHPLNRYEEYEATIVPNLVGGFKHGWIIFQFIYGMSSLTHWLSYFSEELKPPTSNNNSWFSYQGPFGLWSQTVLASVLRSGFTREQLLEEFSDFSFWGSKIPSQKGPMETVVLLPYILKSFGT